MINDEGDEVFKSLKKKKKKSECFGIREKQWDCLQLCSFIVL